MLNINHNMQHVVGCPTWEHWHPNRCWVQKGTWIYNLMFGVQNGYMTFQIDVWFSNMEHGFPNRCLIPHMGTLFAKSMMDFQNGNMILQIDVGCKFMHRVQTMGSNNGFKHDAMHKSGMILICCMMHSLSPPPAFPPVHPFSFQSRAPYSLLATALLALYITQLLNIYRMYSIYDDAGTNHIHCLNAIL